MLIMHGAVPLDEGDHGQNDSDHEGGGNTSEEAPLALVRSGGAGGHETLLQRRRGR